MSYKEEKSTGVFGGVTFSGLLFLVFLVLKLCKVIDWSWWWITAPLWGQVVIMIVAIIIFVSVCSLEERKKQKRLQKAIREISKGE